MPATVCSPAARRAALLATALTSLQQGHVWVAILSVGAGAVAIFVVVAHELNHLELRKLARS